MVITTVDNETREVSVQTIEAINQKKMVVQAYALIKAIQQMSLIEKRLFWLTISFLDREADDFLLYRVSIKNLKDYMGLDGRSVYRDIEKAALSLISRVVKVEDGKKKNSWNAHSVVSNCRYCSREDSETGEAYLEIRLHDSLKPFLLSLKTHFTKFYLFEVSGMPSFNSARLFEILYCTGVYLQDEKKFKYQTLIFKVTDLKKRLGLEDKYKDFKDFRREILQRAQRDFENSPMLFTWKEETKGRKIVAVHFTVYPNPNFKSEHLPLTIGSEAEQKEFLETVGSFQSAGEIAKNAINPQPTPASDFKPVFDNHLAAFSSYEKRKTLDIVKSVPDKDKQAIIDEFNDALNPNKTKPVKQRWQYLRELVRAYEQGKFTSTSELSITREKKQREVAEAKRRAEQKQLEEEANQLKDQFYEARYEKALEIWAYWSEEVRERFLLTNNFVADRYREDGVKSMFVLSNLAEYMAENGYFPADLKSFEAWQEATNNAELQPA